MLTPAHPTQLIHTLLTACQAECYRFLDGMEALLERLAARGVRMHAFSNYPAWCGGHVCWAGPAGAAGAGAAAAAAPAVAAWGQTHGCRATALLLLLLL